MKLERSSLHFVDVKNDPAFRSVKEMVRDSDAIVVVTSEEQNIHKVGIEISSIFIFLSILFYFSIIILSYF